MRRVALPEIIVAFEILAEKTFSVDASEALTARQYPWCTCAQGLLAFTTVTSILHMHGERDPARLVLHVRILSGARLELWRRLPL